MARTRRQGPPTHGPLPQRRNRAIYKLNDTSHRHRLPDAQPKVINVVPHRRRREAV